MDIVPRSSGVGPSRGDPAGTCGCIPRLVGDPVFTGGTMGACRGRGFVPAPGGGHACQDRRGVRGRGRSEIEVEVTGRASGRGQGPAFDAAVPFVEGAGHVPFGRAFTLSPRGKRPRPGPAGIQRRRGLAPSTRNRPGRAVPRLPRRMISGSRLRTTNVAEADSRRHGAPCRKRAVHVGARVGWRLFLRQPVPRTASRTRAVSGEATDAVVRAADSLPYSALPQGRLSDVPGSERSTGVRRDDALCRSCTQGIPSSATVDRPIARAADGRMWVGTVRSWQRGEYDPSESRPDPRSPADVVSDSSGRFGARRFDLDRSTLPTRCPALPAAGRIAGPEVHVRWACRLPNSARESPRRRC